MDGFLLTRMCGRDQDKEIEKDKEIYEIKTQHLCGEYPSWVLYLSFKEEDCGSFFCIILIWMWRGKFFWVRSVYVTLEIVVENMEVF